MTLVDKLDKVTDEDIHRIINWFLNGNSITHIVFLLDYKYKIDLVSGVIRSKLLLFIGFYITIRNLDPRLAEKTLMSVTNSILNSPSREEVF